MPSHQKNLRLLLAFSLLASAQAYAFADDRVTTGPPKLEAQNVKAGEGPSWDPTGVLYFVGGNRISRRDANGKISVFRDPAGGPNGSLVDPQGRLLVCENGGRRVTRYERDGSPTVLADRYEGKRFNSPNDLALDSKGRIYFTDPRYGKRDSMEMRNAAGKLVEGVYRIDAPGQVTRIIDGEMERPNGILVSPGDKYLYLADNNNDNIGGARLLVRFDLKPDGTIDPASKKVIFDMHTARGPDGFKLDQEGRFIIAAGLNKPNLPYETTSEFKGGIFILSPEGKLLEFVPIPNDEVTNCTFGGPDLKTLFVTAGGNLWSIPMKTPGRASYTSLP